MCTRPMWLWPNPTLRFGDGFRYVMLLHVCLLSNISSCRIMIRKDSLQERTGESGDMLRPEEMALCWQGILSPKFRAALSSSRSLHRCLLTTSRRTWKLRCLWGGMGFASSTTRLLAPCLADTIASVHRQTSPVTKLFEQQNPWMGSYKCFETRACTFDTGCDFQLFSFKVEFARISSY